MKIDQRKYSLSSYKYLLPDELIAQVPAKNRDDSRLLVLRKNEKELKHDFFSNITDYFSGNEVLVLNESRVIRARLKGFKETGGAIEILVLNKVNERCFRAMFKTKRGLKSDAKIKIKAIPMPNNSDNQFNIKCLHVDKYGYAIFESQDDIKFEDLLEYAGLVPVPPYIKRESFDEDLFAFDRERYQTIYARIPGSVAAPTAGLHFTEEILSKLREKGVEILKICLHVGPGTFKPIRNEDIREHYIDEEQIFISEKTAISLNLALKERRPIVAVGTTVVRSLEDSFVNGVIKSGTGSAKLYIMPGHKFNVVNRLITNFHVPGSSLILLVSALVGRDKLLFAYKEAIEKKYRFYSYGDCMLIL